jgi:acyl carrier protein
VLPIQSTSTLEAKVLQAVACVMPEIDISKLDMTAELTKEYGVNSVSIIQLIVELENDFNIEFQDSELALGLYYDMNDVVAAVAAKLN